MEICEVLARCVEIWGLFEVSQDLKWFVKIPWDFSRFERICQDLLGFGEICVDCSRFVEIWGDLSGLLAV